MIALLGMFRIVPTWCYGVLAAVMVLGGAAVYERHTGRVEGMATVQAKWDAAIKSAEMEAETLRAARQTTIDKSANQYVEKSVQVRYVTKTIIKEVDRYVPNTLPLLPAAVRVFHDAAATGEEVTDSEIAAGSPVSPADYSKTVIANYGTCNDEKLRLVALQAIVRKLTEASDDKAETEAAR